MKTSSCGYLVTFIHRPLHHHVEKTPCLADLITPISQESCVNRIHLLTQLDVPGNAAFFHNSGTLAVENFRRRSKPGVSNP
jgi:hypothetical protein